MKRALGYVVPAALFAVWIWVIVASIGPMVSKANNNRVHALLLGCQLLGNSKDVEQILYFDCRGKIELHKEIDWAQEAYKGK
jgi:branched-subunit amino acid transport protein